MAVTPIPGSFDRWTLDLPYAGQEYVEMYVTYSEASSEITEDSYDFFVSFSYTGEWFDRTLRNNMNRVVIETFSMPGPKKYYFRVPLAASASSLRLNLEAVHRPMIKKADQLRDIHIEAVLV